MYSAAAPGDSSGAGSYGAVGMYGPSNSSMSAYGSAYAAMPPTPGPAAAAAASTSTKGGKAAAGAAASAAAGAGGAEPAAGAPAGPLTGVEAAQVYPLFFIRPGHTQDNHAFTFSMIRNDRLVSTRIRYAAVLW